MVDPALNQEVHQIQINHKHAIIQRRYYEFKMGEREDYKHSKMHSYPGMQLHYIST